MPTCHLHRGQTPTTSEHAHQRGKERSQCEEACRLGKSQVAVRKRGHRAADFRVHAQGGACTGGGSSCKGKQHRDAPLGSGGMFRLRARHSLQHQPLSSTRNSTPKAHMCAHIPPQSQGGSRGSVPLLSAGLQDTPRTCSAPAQWHLQGAEGHHPSMCHPQVARADSGLYSHSLCHPHTPVGSPLLLSSLHAV